MSTPVTYLRIVRIGWVLVRRAGFQPHGAALRGEKPFHAYVLVGRHEGRSGFLARRLMRTTKATYAAR